MASPSPSPDAEPVTMASPSPSPDAEAPEPSMHTPMPSLEVDVNSPNPESSSVIDLTLVDYDDDVLMTETPQTADASANIKDDPDQLSATIQGQSAVARATSHDCLTGPLNDAIAPVQLASQATNDSPDTSVQQLNEADTTALVGDEPVELEEMLKMWFANAQNDGNNAEMSGDEDHVSVNDSEEEHARAAAAFQAFKKKFEAKKKRGEVDATEEVEFVRAQAAEDRRMKIRRRKLANTRPFSPEEESMFIPEGAGGYAYAEDQASDHEVKEPPRKRARGVKRPEISTRELQDSMAQAFQAVDKKRRGRPKGQKRQSTGASKSKAAASRVAKPPAKRGRPAQGGRKKPTRQERQEATRAKNLLNERSLFDNDIVADAQANTGREGQKRFTATRRNNALKELVASIPADHRDTAIATKKQIDEACKKFACAGTRSIAADGNGDWKLKGMKTSLMSFQLLGAGFMREREYVSKAPFGGIVADSMGFGKTVICIANIIDDMPQIDNNNRTTLVVCPSNICTQWLAEIEKHAEPKAIGEVLLYRSGSRLVSSDPVNSISRHGVVITTYHEVMKSWPCANTPAHLITDSERGKWWEKYFHKNLGPLHRIKFRRIVLDEAHLVKNHKGRMFQAVMGLHGKFRWMMSGTPVQNRREEFYSMFAFLKVPHISSYADFAKKYCNGSDDAEKRLQLMLRTIMIRRTLSNEMFGRPILVLPPLDHQTIEVQFNPIERAIYRIVKKRFIARLNQWMATHADNIKSQYRSIYPYFLRLRMLSSHVLLVQSTIKDLLEFEDVEELHRVTKRFNEETQDLSTRDTISALRDMLRKHVATFPQPIATAEQPIVIEDDKDDIEPTLQVNRMLGGEFGTSFKFFEYLDRLGSAGYFSEMKKRALCAICGEKPDHPQLMQPCCDLFCRSCLEDALTEVAEKEQDVYLCPKCGEAYGEHTPCVGFEDALRRVEAKFPRSARRKSNSSSPQDDCGTKMDWLENPDYVLPSAKTLAVKAQILNWFATDKDARIIIFTQFLGLVHIMGRMCQLENWDYCTYTGKMSTEAREREIEEFKENPEKRILIMSMKSGSLGLNLTRANKVCILDPWWNSSVEAQAYSRVYRIGQELPVEIRRFVVKETIDTELLLVMQQRKDEDIGDAMNEEKMWQALSVQEMLRLFGQVTYDEDGVPIIEEGQSEFTLVEDQPPDDVSDGSAPRDAPPPQFR